MKKWMTSHYPFLRGNKTELSWCQRSLNKALRATLGVKGMMMKDLKRIKIL